MFQSILKQHFFIFFSQLENDPSLTPPPSNWKIPIRFFVLFLKPSLSVDGVGIHGVCIHGVGVGYVG